MICKIHPKYKGKLRPTTLKDCACHYWWDKNGHLRMKPCKVLS